MIRSSTYLGVRLPASCARPAGRAARTRSSSSDALRRPEHELGVGERVDELVLGRRLAGDEHLAGLALEAGEVAEHAADRRRAVGDPVEVLLEPVVEVEQACGPELHDRRRRERLRDRADAVLRVRRRLARRRRSRPSRPRSTRRARRRARRRRRRSGAGRPGARRAAGRASQTRTWAPSAARHELECALDIVLAQIEVRDRPQHAGPHRARERDVVLLEQRDRLPLAEPERLRRRPARSWSGRDRARSARPAPPTPSASRRARAWSSASRSTLWSSA